MSIYFKGLSNLRFTHKNREYRLIKYLPWKFQNWKAKNVGNPPAEVEVQRLWDRGCKLELEP